MSIMDFFSSQGTAQPSPSSSRGNWEDWFLDMEGRKPFGRTISPDEDERGDWIDWYLNREGPAGRFEGSRRPRYDIDYLFNDGGSVQSGPRSSPGPKTRQKLQPRSPEVMLNATQRRINRDQNRWEGVGGQGPFPVWNDPNPQDRRHSLDYMSQGWIEASARDNSGVMSAMAGNDRNWMANNPWFLNLMAKRHGNPSELEGLGLEDEGGLFNLFGADIGVDIGREDDGGWQVGAKATWNTPKLLGG